MAVTWHSGRPKIWPASLPAGQFYLERTSENVAGANADRIYMYQEPLVPRPEDDEESSGEEDEEEED